MDTCISFDRSSSRNYKIAIEHNSVAQLKQEEEDEVAEEEEEEEAENGVQEARSRGRRKIK